MNGLSKGLLKICEDLYVLLLPTWLSLQIWKNLLRLKLQYLVITEFYNTIIKYREITEKKP